MKSYLMILGRQPKLGLAELQRLYGVDSARLLNDDVALLETDADVSIDRLGGTVKTAAMVTRTASNGWLGASKQAVKWIESELTGTIGKVTLGISAYGFDVSPRDVGKTGLVIKAHLKKRDGSVRLVPNDATALSSAQTFHNKFGTGALKREIVIVSGQDGHAYVGDVTGVQNIDAYTLRDRGRPKRDALNGMLPPKLAQTILNLSGATPGGLVWDPFCGTGVVVQEALLSGINAYGSDLNPKMVEFSQANLTWLGDKYKTGQGGPVNAWYALKAGDATSIHIDTDSDTPVQAVACETYLGEPMAQEPTPEKLAKVMAKCEDTVRGFLGNVASQLAPGTGLCIAVPAWRIGGEVKHLSVVDDLSQLGYNWVDFNGVERSDLIYYREDQVVARELLVITKQAEGSTQG